MAQSPLRSSPEGAPDLTGLRGSYTTPLPRAAVVFCSFAALLWACMGVQDVAGGGDPIAGFWLFFAAAGFALMVVAFCIGSKVVLQDGGIRLRTSLRWRTLAWADITEVRPDHSSRYVRAYLVSGRSERLLGLPVEVGDRLHAALAVRQ